MGVTVSFFIRRSRRRRERRSSTSRRLAGIRLSLTCEKIQRPGSGCINIGAIVRQTRTGLIRFTRTCMSHSTKSCATIAEVDKKPACFSNRGVMRNVPRFLFLTGAAAVASMLTSCETGPLAARGGGGPYHVTAYKPNDPSKVRVKLSLSKQNVYVMEGDRCLMAAAVSVGLANKPTPRGNFTIYKTIE